MNNTAEKQELLRRFSSIYDHDWSVAVDTQTGWIRVCDTATAYLLDSTNTHNLQAMEEFVERAQAAGFEWNSRQKRADAYRDFCQASHACHELAAPVEARKNLRVLARLDCESELTFGW